MLSTGDVNEAMKEPSSWLGILFCLLMQGGKLEIEGEKEIKANDSKSKRDSYYQR